MADPMIRYAKIAFAVWMGRLESSCLKWRRIPQSTRDDFVKIAAAVIAAWIKDGVSTVRTFEKKLAKKPKVSRKET